MTTIEFSTDTKAWPLKEAGKKMPQTCIRLADSVGLTVTSWLGLSSHAKAPLTRQPVRTIAPIMLIDAPQWRAGGINLPTQMYTPGTQGGPGHPTKHSTVGVDPSQPLTAVNA